MMMMIIIIIIIINPINIKMLPLRETIQYIEYSQQQNITQNEILTRLM